MCSSDLHKSLSPADQERIEEFQTKELREGINELIERISKRKGMTEDNMNKMADVNEALTDILRDID